MAGFRVRRRHRAHELEVHDADLAKWAGRALYAADERMRVAADELGYAEAQLGAGADAMARLGEALIAARKSLSDAFRLNRLNHDVPGTADEVRARNVRIVQLCAWVEDVLDEQISALADEVARARRAPEFIAGMRADTERSHARIAHTRDTIDRLVAHFARAALVEVEHDLAEAAQLLGFAEHSLGVARRRRDDGQPEPADLELEASAAHLSRLREEHAALDTATAMTTARERAAPRAIAPEARVHDAIRHADRLLDAARDAIADHPGWIGAEALTRLAESERIRVDLGHYLGGWDATTTVTHEGDRERVLAMAGRIVSLAGEALSLARRDIDASRHQRIDASRHQRIDLRSAPQPG
ncbi:hypothetical protein [Agromyces neolithicus]|uniref:Uncharacterized protein n=1 Tax=Agromyces neolithicus TaxID=269420 RepID=A0ABN2M8P4_9MICO